MENINISAFLLKDQNDNYFIYVNNEIFSF